MFRDPVQRMISEYKWDSKTYKNKLPFCDWVDFVIDEYKINPFIKDNHIRPQNEFIVNGCEVYSFSKISNMVEMLNRNDFAEITSPIKKEHDSTFWNINVQVSKSSIDKIIGFYKKDYEWIENNKLM